MYWRRGGMLLEEMIPGFLNDLPTALLLAGYVLVVVFLGKPLHDLLLRKTGMKNVAVYYVRKYIHVLAGGVVALLVPKVFTSPLTPLFMGLALGLFLITTRSLRPLDWFQTRDNAFEVNFTIAWGLSIFVLWLITGNPQMAVVPALFIAFGDAVTGVVRNALFKRRTKHWAGNLAMLPVTLALGWLYAGPAGALAGIVAAIVERYEFPPIDDNVLITLATTLILIAFMLV